MPHVDYCSLCLDYALGEIRDDLLHRRYQHHLQQCAVCQRDLLEYQEIIQLVTTPTQEETLPGNDSALARVVSFPSRNRYRKIRRLWRQGRRRAMTISLSATIAVTTLVFLAHTGHFTHVTALGDTAWHDVTHAFIRDHGDLARDWFSF